MAKDFMDNKNIQRDLLWSDIGAELHQAMVVLLCDPNPALEAKYDLYLKKNELQLAYETLKELGKTEEQLPEFYEALARAAKLMKLKQ